MPVSVENVPLMMDLPEPLFDVKDYLPEAITPAQNGMIPVRLLQKVPCGGQLYIDAARSWNAMVRAAELDKVFLNLNHPLNAYKTLINQRHLFNVRFSKLDSPRNARPGVLCVEFDNQLWQLNEGKEFVECPGVNTHGYALAVFIINENQAPVRAWLDKNAADFGFVREYAFIPGRFVYIKGRESIPPRVLEIESLPPVPKYSAAQIIKYSGCKWFKTPPADWYCTGIFHAEPYRLGALAVADQGNGFGLQRQFLEVVSAQCKAIVCSEPTDALKNFKCPLLISTDVKDTFNKLSKMFETVPPENPSDEHKVETASDERLNFYRMSNPEAVIFERKKKIAAQLLEIPVADLKDASKQSWYGEYHALLSIRLENPALIALGKKYCAELMKWYNERLKKEERELAILGIIQFIEPTALTVPFNEYLLSKEMIDDIRGVFLKYFTRVAYTDEDIINYWLARQRTWKHGKRKMRVMFVIHYSNKADKMIQVFEELRMRDDVETALAIHPSTEYNYGAGDFEWKYFRDKYPDATIFDTSGLFDLRKWKPDYVFYRTPYEWRRHFPSFTTNDVIRFAKICDISYGATLSHTFADRLIEEYPKFYRSLYFMFCSAPTVRDKMLAQYKSGVDEGYRHFEFQGYPVLSREPLPMKAHDKKTILWTPRWAYDARVGGSHFLEYKDNFVALRQRYGDKVNLSMRPHENTFREVQNRNLLTKEEVDAYKQSLKDNKINLYYTTFDLGEQFRLTDILLCDYSSILIEFFLTGRPMVYCEFINAVPFDEYKEMFDCMYIAHNWDDVLKYLDDLVAGNDPLFERRQKAVAGVKALHANATQKIIARLLEDFKSCEDADIDEGTVEDERWK